MKRLLLILIVGILITSLFLNSCITITPRAPVPGQDPDSTQAPASSPESTTPPAPDPAQTPAQDDPQNPAIGPVFIPPLTPVPSPCPAGTSPSQIKHFTIPQQGWDWKPSVTISAKANDPRINVTKKAIKFWNQQFSDIGTRFRLGPVTHITKLAPDDYMLEVTAGMEDDNPRPPLPDSIKRLPGDIIIALSDANFISFSSRPGSEPCFIAIRNSKSPPMSLPNVILNVITHELGHSIGLGHNNDPTTLMCGRPADCRPDSYQCDAEKIFRITKKEKSFLRKLYPTDWRPAR